MATKGREPSPARPLDRRTLLSGSAAALGSLALAGCGESARPPQVSSLATDLAILDRPIVDVHAHIFVASDLPGHQFIVQSFLADYEGKINEHVLTILNAFADVVTDSAPNHAEEMSVLGNGATWQPPTLKKTLAMTFERIGNGDYRPRPLPRCMGAAPVPAPVPTPSQSQRTFNALWRRMASNEKDVRSASETIAGAIAEALQREGWVTRIAQRMAAAVESDSDLLSTALEWLRGFMKSRVERVNDWSKFMSGTRPDAPRFVMPALVDFGFSLDWQDEPTTTFRQQVEIMALLSRRQPANRVMHGYVPFNPWRWALLDEQDRRDSLELVKHAIHDCGFLGVKIYPPMGFQASGNKPILYDQFRRDEGDPTCGVTDTFPAKVDREVSKLYAYCEANDVAIMLHSAPSNEAAKDWGDRADPQFWWSVLEKHPKLRVNFGHFGGGFSLKKKPQGVNYIKTIIALMARFPNVYADLSDYELVLEPDDDKAKLFAKQTDLWAKVYGRKILRERLMFGTDWTFIARIPGYSAYPRALLLYMADRIAIGASETAGNAVMREEAITNFAAGNACSFVGFNDPKGKALPRLLRFYGKGDPDHVDTLMSFVEISRPGARRIAMRR
jgi:predicted TIM-barrel fold metal-dependent hydrolase